MTFLGFLEGAVMVLAIYGVVSVIYRFICIWLEEAPPKPEPEPEPIPEPTLAHLYSHATCGDALAAQGPLYVDITNEDSYCRKLAPDITSCSKGKVLVSYSDGSVGWMDTKNNAVLDYLANRPNWRLRKQP